MKNKIYYVLALVALAFALTGPVDIRQSPPEPTCPTFPEACDKAQK